MKPSRAVEECPRPSRSGGYCPTHYSRWQRTGTVELPAKPTHEQRFWSHVDKSGECWEWTANRNKRGYGAWAIYRHPKYISIMPHRYSYELVHGPIPKGMQIDHVCHNRACVNPNHLRLATNKQNNENPSGVRSDNTSGYRGVTYNPKVGRWYARVQHNNRTYGAGGHATPEEAAEAARQLRLSLFTHNDADRIGQERTKN